MSSTKTSISDFEDYQLILKKIDTLMRLGEKMDDNIADELRVIALVAQEYERVHFSIHDTSQNET